MYPPHEKYYLFYLHSKLMDAISCPDGVSVGVYEAGYNGAPMSIDHGVPRCPREHACHLRVQAYRCDRPITVAS